MQFDIMFARTGANPVVDAELFFGLYSYGEEVGRGCMGWLAGVWSKSD